MPRKSEYCLKGHLYSETRKYHPNGDSYCSKCKHLRQKTYEVDKIKQSHSSWKSRIKKMYGVTESDYIHLYTNQNGKCAICSNDLLFRDKSTHIDHNHETGEVRGLLCHYCNTALGLFKEDSELLNKAIEYMSKAGKSRKKK